MICSAFVLSSSTVYSTCLQSQDLSEAKVNQYTSKTDFFFLGLCNVAMCVGCTIYCIQYISDGWSLPCRRCAPPLRPGMYVWSKSTWYQVESRNAPFRLAEARRTDALSLVSPAKLRPCPGCRATCVFKKRAAQRKIGILILVVLKNGAIPTPTQWTSIPIP